MTSEESIAVERAKTASDAHLHYIIQLEDLDDEVLKELGVLEELRSCECPYCRPDLYPPNIQDLLDVDMRETSLFLAPEIPHCKESS